MANLLNLGSYKKYLTLDNILIFGGGGLLLFYLTTQGASGKAVAKAIGGPGLDYKVTPLSLPPGQPGAIYVEGAFDNPVDEGFFYVTDANLIPITHGSLGKGITTFKKSIMLPALPLGQYNLSITDEEIDPLRGGKPLPTMGGDQ